MCYHLARRHSQSSALSHLGNSLHKGEWSNGSFRLALFDRSRYRAFYFTFAFSDHNIRIEASLPIVRDGIVKSKRCSILVQVPDLRPSVLLIVLAIVFYTTTSNAVLFATVVVSCHPARQRINLPSSSDSPVNSRTERAAYLRINTRDINTI